MVAVRGLSSFIPASSQQIRTTPVHAPTKTDPTRDTGDHGEIAPNRVTADRPSAKLTTPFYVRVIIDDESRPLFATRSAITFGRLTYTEKPDADHVRTSEHQAILLPAGSRRVRRNDYRVFTLHNWHNMVHEQRADLPVAYHHKSGETS